MDDTIFIKTLFIYFVKMDNNNFKIIIINNALFKTNNK